MCRLEITVQIPLLAMLLALPAFAQQAEPSEKEQLQQTSEEEKASPEPRRRGGKILLPGAGAYGQASPSPPSSSGSSAPVIPPPTAERSVEPSNSAAAAEPSRGDSKATGDLFWSGRIYKNGRIRISVNNQTTAGTVEGDPLPGVPVIVDARSPVVEILEQPNARNGYKSFEFQVKKTRKKPVSFNFHWVLQ